MKKFKRILSAAMITVMTLSLAACGSSEKGDSGSEKKTFSLKLSHYRAEGSPADINAKEFAENVKAADDSMEVVVYPAAQLGDYTAVQELVSVGDVEMQMATLSSTVDKYLGITSAPYICATWDEAKAIFSRDSKFTDTIRTHLEEQNIKLLSVYPLYFGGAILNEKPNKPADLDVREGYKVRCQTMKGAELVTNMLGYNATPMALNDCFTALQTGVIDGMIGSGAEGYYSSYRDVATYYLTYNDHFEVWYLYVNLDAWNEMTKEQQEALQAAANKLEDDRWKVAPEETAEYEQKLADYGVEIINFTDDELQNFYNKCWETVWPELTELYGEDAVKLVKDLKANAE